jgi:two-component system chemotaxis response regulator CheB
MRRLFKDLVAKAEDFRLVAAVEDAATAVARARDLQPDVVLLDLDMPGSNGARALSGQQLLRQLSLVTAAPILGLAAITQPGSWDSAAAYNEGAALVLGKPSGILSLDLIERRGEAILGALRRLAGAAT